MANNRLRRIQKEIHESAADDHSNVSIKTDANRDELDHLEGTFPGPPDTPYEGGIFQIDIVIPTDYPFRPPKMKFKTKIWHPNVSSQTGAICLDTLAANWSPVLTIKSALISIQGLLASPEPKDPQDAEVASMLLKDPRTFERTAREWAIRFAGAAPKMITESNGVERAVPISAANAVPNKAMIPRNNTGNYHGYHPDLIQRFCAMGFDVDRVVAAFEYVGIETNEGQDWELDEEYMGDVTARLFGES